MTTSTLRPPPPLPQSKQPRNPISRKQVERVLSRSVAVFGLVFGGAQSFPAMLTQTDEAYPFWLLSVVPALYATLVVIFIASLTQRAVKFTMGLFAVVYFVALVTWPLAIMPDAEIFTGIHWLNYLISVAAAMAAIAFTPTIASTYVIATVVFYSVVRATPLGGGAPPMLAILEGFYALFLSGIVVVVITLIRQAASSVDTAQSTALDRYSHAVRQHATEVERVQVDAIVHDSVLTTFISAARAYTPEAKALAATMAGNAIGYLRDAAAASPDDGTMVRYSTVVDRIVDTAAQMSSPFELRLKSVGTRSMPAHAAETMYSAAVQAMMNSLAHAGDGVDRWVSARSIPHGGMRVEIGDTGKGFAMEDIASERLGVRVSIIERLANAGGRATIVSAPGEGTVIKLRWPHAEPPGRAEATTGGDA
jgi:signal transduction histidine kinase